MKKKTLLFGMLSCFLAVGIATQAHAAYPMNLDRVNPGAGHAGTTVQLHGSNFGASQAGHRVVIRHESAYLRDMTVRSWSNTQITAVVPPDAMAGPNTIAILNPVGRTGPVNASGHVPFTVQPSLKPGVIKPGVGIGSPSPVQPPALKPGVTLKPAGCPDPAVMEVRPGWPGRNSDGTYNFKLYAVVKNVGSAPFESARRQTQITLREGPRVLKSDAWPSRWADRIVLAPGESFSSPVFYVAKWNPGSEFLAEFSAEISYDPDVRVDNNPKNDDCVVGNNRKTLSVTELRRILGVR